jgi:hypothetical protein
MAHPFIEIQEGVKKELLEKIETEIKRRKQSWKHSDKQYVAGGRDMCDYLLGFIDTLKTEQ